MMMTAVQRLAFLAVFCCLQFLGAYGGDKIYTGLDFVQDEQQQTTLLSQLCSYILSSPDDLWESFTVQKSGKFWGVTAWNNVNRALVTSELRRKTAISLMRLLPEETLERLRLLVWALEVAQDGPLRRIEAAREEVVQEMWKLREGGGGDSGGFDRERLLAAAAVTFQQECHQGYQEARLYWDVYRMLTPDQLAYLRAFRAPAYAAAAAIADYDYGEDYADLYAEEKACADGVCVRVEKTTQELLAERAFVFCTGTEDDAQLIDRGKPVNYYGFSKARDDYRKNLGDSDEFRSRLAIFMRSQLTDHQIQRILDLFIEQQDLLLEWVNYNTEMISLFYRLHDDENAELNEQEILDMGYKWGLVEGKLLLLQLERYAEVMAELDEETLQRMREVQNGGYVELAQDAWSPEYYQFQLESEREDSNSNIIDNTTSDEDSDSSTRSDNANGDKEEASATAESTGSDGRVSSDSSGVSSGRQEEVDNNSSKSHNSAATGTNEISNGGSQQSKEEEYTINDTVHQDDSHTRDSSINTFETDAASTTWITDAGETSGGQNLETATMRSRRKSPNNPNTHDQGDDADGDLNVGNVETSLNRMIKRETERAEKAPRRPNPEKSVDILAAELSQPLKLSSGDGDDGESASTTQNSDALVVKNLNNNDGG